MSRERLLEKLRYGAVNLGSLARWRELTEEETRWIVHLEPTDEIDLCEEDYMLPASAWEAWDEFMQQPPERCVDLSEVRDAAEDDEQ